nr:hypothetical protein [Tanacetum cinerariifolium]
ASARPSAYPAHCFPYCPSLPLRAGRSRRAAPPGPFAPVSASARPPAAGHRAAPARSRQPAWLGRTCSSSAGRSGPKPRAGLPQSAAVVRGRSAALRAGA